MQVGGAGRYRHQFTVGPADHRFAMHVTDMPTEQPRGAGGGLVLPLPVADVEGHFDRQVVLLVFIEETLERFDAPAVQGLVVFDQQLHRALAQLPRQRLEIVVVGEVAEGDFQPFGAECLGPLQGYGQLGIGFRLTGEPQLNGRGVDAFQALGLGGVGQLRRVFNRQQLFAPFDARGAGGGQYVDKTALTELTDQVGAVARQADGNGWFIHCYLPLKPVSFLFKKIVWWACRPHREQARSHRGFMCAENPLWERACSRWGHSSHRKSPTVEPRTINCAAKSSVRTAPSSPRKRLSRHSNALAPICAVGCASAVIPLPTNGYQSRSSRAISPTSSNSLHCNSRNAWVLANAAIQLAQNSASAYDGYLSERFSGVGSDRCR